MNDADPSEPQQPAAPQRRSGVLLHPTSLPGAHGIGDFGDDAFRWVEYLRAGRQTLWQVMPLGPPGYGESPYAARSAFAGNPLLLSLPRLVEDGLLDWSDLDGAPDWPAGRVDFARVAEFKLPLFDRAYARYRDGGATGLREEYHAFREAEAGWLDDYALYAALKRRHDGASWYEWDTDLIQRKPEALKQASESLADEVDRARFIEFLFRRQWSAVLAAARAAGIALIGDIPIFVAHDSADVWANQELFHLDEHGQPTIVAGVPPDYFSPTGQRWGNPLYRWDRLAETGYRWWIDRFRSMLTTTDVVRIDHFRGFASYWAIPAAEDTAVNGEWQPGPGEALFTAASDALGAFPIIVEDLGLITPDVEALRADLGYPGMKVLQFAFGDTARNPYLPHNYEPNCVVYTGTHDNDTTEGWFSVAPEPERAAVIRYAGDDPAPISRKLIRMALASVARDAIIPLQDLLALGNEARMNVPGQGTSNWAWRATPEQIDPGATGWLADLTALYARTPPEPA